MAVMTETATEIVSVAITVHDEFQEIELRDSENKECGFEDVILVASEHCESTEEKKEEKEDDDTCVICLDPLECLECLECDEKTQENKVISFDCKHKFHLGCTIEYLTSLIKKRADISCPTCRFVQCRTDTPSYEELKIRLGIPANIPDEFELAYPVIGFEYEYTREVHLEAIRRIQAQQSQRRRTINVNDNRRMHWCSTMFFVFLIFMTFILVTFVVFMVFNARKS